MKKTIYLLTILLVILLSVISYAKSYRITLEWDRNTETDLAGYNLYMCESGLFQDANIVDIIKDPNAYTTEIDVNITRTIYFYLTAYDTSNNESDESNSVDFTPDIIPPSSPGGFKKKSCLPL